MAPDKLEVTAQVVKIDPAGKYVVLFPYQLSDAAVEQVRSELRAFMAGGSQFAVIEGGARIERVDQGQEPSKLGATAAISELRQALSTEMPEYREDIGGQWAQLQEHVRQALIALGEDPEA